MTKQQFIKALTKELERLETVERLSDMAKSGCYEEIDIVMEKIDYSILNEYVEGDNFEKCSISDIPYEYTLTYAIYMHRSEYNEEVILKDWKEFQKRLRDFGDVGKAIAKTLDTYYINLCNSFKDLIEERDEED